MGNGNQIAAYIDELVKARVAEALRPLEQKVKDFRVSSTGSAEQAKANIARELDSLVRTAR